MTFLKRFTASPLFIFALMFLGICTGLFNIPFLFSLATTTSDIFINLLKLISLPIIFLAITSTISGMSDLKEMRFLGKKVFTYTILTTIISATIALILFLVINPTDVNLGSAIASVDAPSSEQPSYLSFLVQIVPANIIQAFIDNNVIGIAFVAILFSFSILFLPPKHKEPLHLMFSSLFAAVLKMTGFIVKFMPIGVWAFTTLLVKDLQSNFEHGEQLLWYLACVTGANLLQGIVVLPLLLKFKKISPRKALKGMAPALTLAFFSKSSNATLPLTIKCCEENLGVSRKISNFALPLCSVINMNACAGFILTTVLFVSMMNGVVFSPFEFVAWIFIATIAAIGNAGVPMGCYFLASAFLISMNVPLHIMGIILPFYTLLDMVETAINVWSDACVAIVVDKEVSPALINAENIALKADIA